MPDTPGLARLAALVPLCEACTHDQHPGCTGTTLQWKPSGEHGYQQVETPCRCPCIEEKLW